MASRFAECTLATPMVQPASIDPRRHRTLWIVVTVSITASILASYQVSTMSLVLGSESGRWVYEYLAHFTRHSARVLLQVLAVAALLTAAPLALIRRHQWPMVLMWLVAGMVLQAELRSQTRYTLQQMFESDGANGYYTAITKHSADEVVRNFETIRPTLAVHAKSNMPGKLLFLHALTLISIDPALLPWLVVAVSNLGGLLMYLFVRDLTGDRVTGLFALVLYLFVPAKLYFFPILNTITPVVVLGFAWLWLHAVRGGRPVHAAGLGVAFYALVFFEPLPLVTGGMFAVLIWQMVRTGRLTWLTLGRQAAIAAAAALAVHAAMRMVFDFDLFRAFQLLMADAVDFNREAQRPYGVWLGQNLLDFGFAMGVSQAVLMLGLLAVATWQRWWTDAAVAATAGLVAVVLVTNALGVNRGEVVRLWIFLACLLQIPAASICARLDSRAALLLVLTATIVQGALGTAMMGFATP